MKTTIRLFLLLIIVLVANACLSNKKLSESGSKIMPFSESVTTAEGCIVYGLPRSVFTVQVVMERTVEKPGPYARFAGELLGLNDVIESENESWSIEGISVKSHDEIDPSEYYIIQSNNMFSSNALKLKKEGLILDLNPAIINPAFYKTPDKEQDINQLRSADLGSDEYFRTQVDTAYRRINVDSSFIRIPYIVENKRRLTIDQLAEKAARRLMEMRDGMHLILTGEATVFPQSVAAINEINRLEKEYAELFTGKAWKETRTFSYEVIPEKEMIGKPPVLFQFSEFMGPVTGSIKGGKSVTIEFVPEQKTKNLSLINNKQPLPGVPVVDKLFYRVPDVVNVKISMGPEILFNSRRLIYQFGEVIQLPGNFIIGK